MPVRISYLEFKPDEAVRTVRRPTLKNAYSVASMSAAANIAVEAIMEGIMRRGHESVTWGGPYEAEQFGLPFRAPEWLNAPLKDSLRTG